ncbi:MAG: DUF456 domain-containing protein [bacterium]
MQWQEIAAGLVVGLAVCLGMVLALLTLPGVWLMLLTAVLVKLLWMPELIGPWTLAVCLVLAIAGELIEALASAAGTSRFGGSQAGAVASIVGGLVGAVLGTFVIPIPIVGTILGAILGSALATFATEVLYKQRPTGQALHAATGAAIGRTAATIIKVFITGVVGLILLASVLVAWL